MRLWPRRRVYVDDLPKTHDARFLGAFLVIFVGILGAVYLVGYLAVGDKVPGGTTVGGAAIGGLTRDDAAVMLRHRFASQLAKPVTLQMDSHRVTVPPSTAGVSLDVAATLDEAMQGSAWDPRHLLKVASGGGRVDPVFRVDRARLASVLEPLAAEVAQQPVSSRVIILGGRADVHPGQVGRRLDVAKTATALSQSLVDGRRLIVVRAAAVQPALGVGEATSFANNDVNKALHGPVTVVVDHSNVRLNPSQFAPALRIDSSSGRFLLSIDPDVLLARTQGVLAAMPGRPVDARIVFRNGRPAVQPGRPGRTVGRDAWAAAVLAAAQADDRRSVARSSAAQPGFTTADARALHIQRLIGDATAMAPAQNAGPLRVAARRLDGSVVLPGADFSYTRAVGPSSAGTVATKLGSVTSTAALHAGMAITKPPGGPGHSSDLTFRNPSVFPVYIRSWVGPPGGHQAPIVVQVWGSPAG